MSVAALAHPRMRAWPKVARDSLRLALWSADEIAEATRRLRSALDDAWKDLRS